MTVFLAPGSPTVWQQVSYDQYDKHHCPQELSQPLPSQDTHQRSQLKHWNINSAHEPITNTSPPTVYTSCTRAREQKSHQSHEGSFLQPVHLLKSHHVICRAKCSYIIMIYSQKWNYCPLFNHNLNLCCSTTLSHHCKTNVIISVHSHVQISN